MMREFTIQGRTPTSVLQKLRLIDDPITDLKYIKNGVAKTSWKFYVKFKINDDVVLKYDLNKIPGVGQVFTL